jgi:putative hydroxymethylpyrimidine transport system substrate-binding protein
MRKKLLFAIVVLAVTVVPAASAAAREMTLTLDWTPNPDHVGLYYARDTGLFDKAGLDVTIRPPSDPTAPLKLVAAGKSDLAISYEQELFFAGARKLPVVAVAAVIPQPLNSIMAIDAKIRSVGDLKGRTIGIAGVPADYASLDTVLSRADLSRKDVRIANVGYNLLPALLSRKVDAIIGVYRNIEGVELRHRGLKPTIIPLQRAGVPTYDELVLVASATRLRSDAAYADSVRRFVGAFLAGSAQARSHPEMSLSIMRKVTSGDKKVLAETTPATLELLAGPKGVGCLSQTAWARFGAWMYDRGLLKTRVAASTMMTTRYLPSRC